MSVATIWSKIANYLIDFPGHPGSGPNDPSVRSPVVERWQAELALVRILYEGFKALYDHRRFYLPPHPAEDPADYDIRSRRPTFYNAFGRTVRSLAGTVFNSAPEREGIPAPILELYEDDIDNQGTAGDTFLRHSFEDALVTGLTGIFVDMPVLDGEGRTRADELDAGIRPYWISVPKDNVYSFRLEVEAGKTVMAQLIFCEKRDVPYGKYGVKEVELLRVLRRTAPPVGQPFVTQELFQKGDNGKWVSIGGNDLPAVTEIPFAQIYTGRVAFMDARPPLIDLAWENLLHFQTRSDMHHAAHIANVPVLFGVGLDESEVQVGPNRAILVKGLKPDEATLRWLETTGAALGQTRAILSDIDEYMANLGLGMLQRKSRAAETAEKASLDKKEQDSTLVGIVGDLENGIEQALFYTAQYLGLEEGGKLLFSRDFQTDPAAAQRTENQGEPKNPDEPKGAGQTNNPKTSE